MAQMNKSTFLAMMTTNKEFFQQIARFKDARPQTAAEWWAAIQEVIVRQVFYEGCCRLPGIGLFTIEEKPEQIQKQVSGGKTVIYRVPARIVPVFHAEDDFINDINMSGVTRAYRKRLKANALTYRDIERQLRADEVGEVVQDMMAERKESAQVALQELLKQKRDAKKGDKKDELSERSKDSDTEA